MDWSISVGGRFGLLATPGTLLYVLGAYTHAELDKSRVNVSIDDPLGSFIILRSPNPTAIALDLPDSLDGFTLGGGGEAKLGKNSPWSLKLEYRWSHFDGGSAGGSSSDEECFPFINTRNSASVERSKPPPRRISMMSTSIPCAACSRTVSGAPQKWRRLNSPLATSLRPLRLPRARPLACAWHPLSPIRTRSRKTRSSVAR